MSVNLMRSGGVMRSSYLRMTRGQTVMVKRWRNRSSEGQVEEFQYRGQTVRGQNLSSHDLKKQFEEFQGQKVTESRECQEILARTRQGLASGEQTEGFKPASEHFRHLSCHL